MKGISNQFKQALFYDERNYLAFADIFLADGTALTLTNSEIWAGGFSYEESVSEDNQFTAIGSVIIGSATIIINNIDEFYSVYDFTNAEVVLHIGMQFPDRLEKHQIGVYTVDETSYNGGTITLRLLDNLKQFDRPYSQSELAYPATLQSILMDCCTKCGVQLSPHSAAFPHSSFVIQDAPEDKDATTFRDVVSWIATLAGCFVKCTADGKIELKWFDTETLESIDEIIDGGKFRPWESDDVDGGLMYPWENLSTIDGGTINPWTVGRAVDGGSFNPWFKDGIVDGGVFNPWSEGDSLDAGAFTDVKNIQYIYNLSSQNIDMDDVVITGVSVTLEDNDSDQRDSIYINTGTDDYEIQLNPNPFITKDNAQDIIDWLGVQLIGLRFRRLNVTHLDDPSIEAGDVGIVIDRKQNVYKVLITRATFSIGSLQTIVCGAATPSRNSATQFSAQTKNYVRSRKLLKEEKSIREQLIDDLNNKINTNGGLYLTVEHPPTGGSIFYLHNHEHLEESTTVWKMTTNAWSVTDNYQGDSTVWTTGMTADGELIANIMSTIGLNFDWGVGGKLQIKGDSTEVFYADAGTGIVRVGNWNIRPSNTSLHKFGANSLYATTTYDGYNYEKGMLSSIGSGDYAFYVVRKPTSVANWGTSSDEVMFYVNNRGYLYANNGGNFRGQITALSGMIGGNASRKIQIGTDGTNASIYYLKSSRDDTSNNGFYIGTDGFALGKGTFKVTADGALTATNGTFKGAIQSGSSITGSTITGSTITAGSGTKTIVLSTTASPTLTFKDTSVKSANQTAVQIYSEVFDNTYYDQDQGIFVDNPGAVLTLKATQDIQMKIGNTTAFLCGDGQTGLGSISDANRFPSGAYTQIPKLSVQTIRATSVVVSGTKPREVATENYGKRLLYCYETPSPMFGDVGEGIIAEDGICRIALDAVFSETIVTSNYQVFLQRYGEGDCYVLDRKPTYFIVKGTPNLAFGWEIKSRQIDFANLRLDQLSISDINVTELEEDYGASALDHIVEIQNERIGK